MVNHTNPPFILFIFNCLIEFCNQNHPLKVLRFVIIVSFFLNVCRILGHWNAYASGFAQVTDFMFTSGHSLVTKYKQKKPVFESMFGENESKISLHVRFVVILWIVYFFHGENRVCFGPVIPSQCPDYWSELMAIFCQRNFAKKGEYLI